MKICHVSFGVIRADDPGRWLTTVPYFTRILSAMAAEHQVFSFHYSNQDKSLQFDRVGYRFLKDSAGEMLSCSNVIRLVDALSPDVIILHGLHSSWRAWIFTTRWKNCPIYIQHHSEKPFRGVKSFLQKRVDRHVREYFFASDAMADEWVHKRLIGNRGKVHEVFEATSSFPDVQRERPNTNPLSFIWVGRLDENKDPLTLIDAFIEFLDYQPAAELYMIFKTQDLLDHVKNRIVRFGKSIHLVGNVPHAEMPYWYKKANFIVSTSLYEVGAVAVVEAMSAGCIPILTDIPALAKITSNGQVGLLYQPKQPGLLASALVRASQLDVKAEREKLNQFYEDHLSPSAIAMQMIAAISVSQRESSSV